MWMNVAGGSRKFSWRRVPLFTSPDYHRHDRRSHKCHKRRELVLQFRAVHKYICSRKCPCSHFLPWWVLGFVGCGWEFVDESKVYVRCHSVRCFFPVLYYELIRFTSSNLCCTSKYTMICVHVCVYNENHVSFYLNMVRVSVCLMIP